MFGSISHGITHISWTPGVNYCVHKSLKPVPILSHLNLLCTLYTYFFEIISIASSHLHLGVPNDFILSCFLTKMLFTFYPMCITCSAPLIPHNLDHPNKICLGVKFMELIPVQFSPVCCYFLCLRAKHFQHCQTVCLRLVTLLCCVHR